MSIIGIGVDRIAIARIQRSYQRFETRFIQRIYSEQEYHLAQQKGLFRRLAMFFAAKEAVAKALGTGFVGFGMKDIEVYYVASGQPHIRLHPAAQTIAQHAGIQHIHLSLTDDDGVAMAFAIAECTPQE
ncbi:MAG: holo-ACP synthase [Mariprofundaceae bacterium]|nr:holo-ACP synthase [Mariprofundaceae bacterium]